MDMMWGEPSIFAIECEVAGTLEDCVYGHFRFWASDISIGDYNDWMLLRAGARFLIDSLQHFDNRYEPWLIGKSKEEVFDLLYGKYVVMIPPEVVKLEDILALSRADDNPAQSALDFSQFRARFSLDSVGMSSFMDSVSVLLVEGENKSQRLIWREFSTMQISEAVLPPKYFEKVAVECLAWVRTVLPIDD